MPSAASVGRSFSNVASGVQRTLSSATASDEVPRWKRPSAASAEVRNVRNVSLIHSGLSSYQSSQSDLPTSSAGRVAAAAAAFKFSQGQPSAPPRAPPRSSPGESTEPEQGASHHRTGSRGEPASGHLVQLKVLNTFVLVQVISRILILSRNLEM